MATVYPAIGLRQAGAEEVTQRGFYVGSIFDKMVDSDDHNSIVGLDVMAKSWILCTRVSADAVNC